MFHLWSRYIVFSLLFINSLCFSPPAAFSRGRRTRFSEQIPVAARPEKPARPSLGELKTADGAAKAGLSTSLFKDANDAILKATSSDSVAPATAFHPTPTPSTSTGGSVDWEELGKAKLGHILDPYVPKAHSKTALRGAAHAQNPGEHSSTAVHGELRGLESRNEDKQQKKNKPVLSRLAKSRPVTLQSFMDDAKAAAEAASLKARTTSEPAQVQSTEEVSVSKDAAEVTLLSTSPESLVDSALSAAADEEKELRLQALDMGAVETEQDLGEVEEMIERSLRRVESVLGAESFARLRSLPVTEEPQEASEVGATQAETESEDMADPAVGSLDADLTTTDAQTPARASASLAEVASDMAEVERKIVASMLKIQSTVGSGTYARLLSGERPLAEAYGASLAAEAAEARIATESRPRGSDGAEAEEEEGVAEEGVAAGLWWRPQLSTSPESLLAAALSGAAAGRRRAAASQAALAEEKELPALRMPLPETEGARTPDASIAGAEAGVRAEAPAAAKEPSAADANEVERMIDRALRRISEIEQIPDCTGSSLAASRSATESRPRGSDGAEAEEEEGVAAGLWWRPQLSTSPESLLAAALSGAAAGRRGAAASQAALAEEKAVRLSERELKAEGSALSAEENAAVEDERATSVTSVTSAATARERAAAAALAAEKLRAQRAEQEAKVLMMRAKQQKALLELWKRKAAARRGELAGGGSSARKLEPRASWEEGEAAQAVLERVLVEQRERSMRRAALSNAEAAAMVAVQAAKGAYAQIAVEDMQRAEADAKRQ